MQDCASRPDRAGRAPSLTFLENSTVLPRLRRRARLLRARVVGFPYNDKFAVTVMLLLTVVVPGAFVESSR